MEGSMKTSTSGRPLKSVALSLVSPQILPLAAHASTAMPAPATLDIAPQIVVLNHLIRGSAHPPSSSDCIAAIGFGCYLPSDMAHQYDFTPEYAAGHDGAGQTIVIVDSFGSPTIAQDLATYDAELGQPAPPSVKIYQHECNVDRNDDNRP